MDLFRCVSWSFVIFDVILILTPDMYSSTPTAPTFLNDSRTCSGSFCYQAYDTEVIFSVAWDFCHNSSRHLAMPKNMTEETFIETYITGTGSNQPVVWIGLIDVLPFTAPDQFDFKWSDMDPLVAGAFKEGQPSDLNGVNEACIEKQREGWDNTKCSNKRSFICQEYSDICTGDSPFNFKDKCYRLVTNRTTFSTELCRYYGGRLAMPKTEAEINYIVDINYNDVPLWVGLSGQYRSGLWHDNETLSEQLQANFLSDTLDMNSWNTVLLNTSQFNATVDPNTKASYICEVAAVCLPISVDNGEDITETFLVGTVLPVTCDLGFAPVHDNTTCMASGWKFPPSCSIIECPPASIDNGDDITETVLHGSSRPVICDVDYLPDYSVTTCIDNATLSPLPKCIPRSHCTCITPVNTTEEFVLDISILKVEVDTLSSTRRKLTSAPDNRPSAKYIGFIGSTFIAVTLGLLLLSDLVSLRHGRCSNTKQKVGPEQ